MSFLILLTFSAVLIADLGGPDGFGYMWADDEEADVTYSWIIPDTANEALFPTSDDDAVAIPIPFSVTYYGITYSDSIIVSTNGVVGFDMTLIDRYSNVAIPSSDAPNAAMYPYWDDLTAQDSSHLYYHTEGTTPDRTFVITWFNWFRLSYETDPEDPLYFQVLIHEAEGTDANEIVFQYLDPTMSDITYSNGADATIGIEDQDGLDGLMYSFNTASLDSGRAIKFWRGETSTHDCGVLSIIEPTGDIMSSSATDVVAVLRNFGSADESVVPAYLDVISGTDTVFSAAETTSILAGALDTLTFAGWIPGDAGSYLISVYVDVAGDTVAFNDSAVESVTVWGHISRGGPDDDGYMWYDSYDPEGPSYVAPPVDSADVVSDIVGDDDAGLIELPFTFPFYGEDFDKIVVSTNGWISFDSTLTSSYLSNYEIPNSSVPNALLATYWDDTDVDIYSESDAAIMEYYDVSSASFWIIFNKLMCPYSASSNPITYGVRLYMDGTIEFHYMDAASDDPTHSYGASATVGIENLDGTDGLMYQFEGTPLGNPLFDHFAIRFVPPWTGEDTLGPVITHVAPDSVFADVPGFCLQINAVMRDFNRVEDAMIHAHHPVTETRAADSVAGDTYYFNICGLQPGDSVSYHFEADDTLDNHTVSNSYNSWVKNPHQGGPDIVGYHFVDSWAVWDTMAPTSAEWIEINPDSGGLGTEIIFGFSGLSPKIGFSEYVPFYGIISGGVIISKHGWALMDTSLAGIPISMPPATFPNPDQPNAFIAPLWTSLEDEHGGLTGGGVYYYDHESAIPGESCFIIQWDMYETETPTTDLMRFQAKIYYDEDTYGSRIEFVYRNIDDFDKEVTGICMEHETGYDGLAYMYLGAPENAPIPTNGSAVLFYNSELHDIPEVKFPEKFALNAYPNPFNASVSIDILGAGPETSLEIFDINGRSVRSFEVPNSGRILWHGTDTDGRALPSGIYFARLKSGEEEIRTRLVLLK